MPERRAPRTPPRPAAPAARTSRALAHRRTPRAPARQGRIFVGTSGWNYPSWRQDFYRGMPQRAWLAHAAATFGALEINGSFYVQIAPATYRRWRDATPRDFRFALKGHRFVTHYKRLRDVDDSIVRLREQARALGRKLAVVLWQLPANLGADVARLRAFLVALRRFRGVRHAIEFRHRSWFTSEVETLLRRARVAVCLSDAPDFPLWRAVTTDLVYVRLHGHTRKYRSSYARGHLARWAADARAWARTGHDVHIYFDNDAEGAAVHDALALRALLGLPGAGPPPRRARRAAPAVAPASRASAVAPAKINFAGSRVRRFGSFSSRPLGNGV